jgi:hypothetical protein
MMIAISEMIRHVGFGFYSIANLFTQSIDEILKIMLIHPSPKPKTKFDKDFMAGVR